MTELDLEKFTALSTRTLAEQDFPGEAYDLARATLALIKEVRQLRAIIDHPTAGAAGRSLYERLQALIPNAYPHDWDDLVLEYRNAFAIAARGTERA
ncbi:hypothetical protein [Burkholderia multivorans]|uniref:Uncharacterized protein n=1 Tax=Burkholderia multivorans TaxID=87883 RepID=A0AB37APS7_9BURK|nr:hypothetical protein [Burkholderia multivorans]MBU9589608.1 hypothetical protein [Burkholderia multivorans]PRE39316.1 hypothetical protein C6P97_31020 [Burkholderia multivorans]PRE42265.1 hypothetical protein C6P99_24585 [Burkholderia multivorans]